MMQLRSGHADRQTDRQTCAQMNSYVHVSMQLADIYSCAGIYVVDEVLVCSHTVSTTWSEIRAYTDKHMFVDD